MNEIVKFAVVGTSVDIDDNYTYLDSKIKKILEEVNLNNNDYGLDILEVSEKVSLDNNTDYCLGFSYEDNKYDIYFIFETYDNTKQLEIIIESDISDDKLSCQTLADKLSFVEKLKISIKNNILYKTSEGRKKEWEKCIWLKDKQSKIYASYLYNKIYETENFYREFINNVMVKIFGADWWDKVVPKDIKDEHKQRGRGYNAIVPTLNDVDERLMSIDTSRLFQLSNLKLSKFNYEKNNEIEELAIIFKKRQTIEKIGNRYINDIIKILTSNLEHTNNLWDEYFSKYLSTKFEKKFQSFSNNRNHVAHNKMLDKTAFNIINKSIDEVYNELVSALQEFNSDYKSLETIEIERLEEEYDIEEENQTLIGVMSEEAGVNIRNDEEIYEIFEDAIMKLFEGIEDGLRFRLDISLSDINQIVYCSDKQDLFNIKNLVNNEEISVSCNIDIDKSQGAKSELVINIKYDDIEKEYRIPYINGEASFDYEQCNYMPQTEDEFGELELEEAISSIIDFVNDNLKSIREEIDRVMYRIVKEGGTSPVADSIQCWNCGEEYICVKENYGDIGQCLNCGEINDIYQCEICGNYVDELTELERCYGCTPKDFFKD